MKKNQTEETVDKVGRTQKVSASYSIKALKDHAKKLKDMEYITGEQYLSLLDIHRTAAESFMFKELGV